MTRLRLRLLGQVSLEVDGREVRLPPTDDDGGFGAAGGRGRRAGHRGRALPRRQPGETRTAGAVSRYRNASWTAQPSRTEGGSELRVVLLPSQVPALDSQGVMEFMQKL